MINISKFFRQPTSEDSFYSILRKQKSESQAYFKSRASSIDEQSLEELGNILSVLIYPNENEKAASQAFFNEIADFMNDPSHYNATAIENIMTSRSMFLGRDFNNNNKDKLLVELKSKVAIIETSLKNSLGETRIIPSGFLIKQGRTIQRIISDINKADTQTSITDLNLYRKYYEAAVGKAQASAAKDQMGKGAEDILYAVFANNALAKYAFGKFLPNISAVANTSKNMEYHISGINDASQAFCSTFEEQVKNLSNNYDIKNSVTGNSLGKMEVKWQGIDGKGVQQKADLTLTLTNGLTEGLSIKNVAEARNAHFQTSRLFYFLSSVVFLEQFSAGLFRNAIWKKYKNISKDQYEKTQTILKNTLKFNIILLAMFGNGIETGSNGDATIMLINVKNKRRLYAFSIQKVYNNLIKKSNISSFPIKEIDSADWIIRGNMINNKNNVNSKITQILLQNISVSNNQNFLNNLFS